MKRILFFLSFIVHYSVSGQSSIVFVDESDDRIPEVKFIASSINDSTLIKKIATTKGEISLGAVEGVFAVLVVSFGFDEYRDTLTFPGNHTIKLTITQEIDEVCVTAQYKPTSLENAVQKITIISAQVIQQSGANNLADVMNYQTGIRMSQDNILGSSLDLAGISGQNVKVLIDGIPVIGRENGNVDLSQINLNNVERIEVVEGPLSVNYGTNALAGTINIITKKTGKAGMSVEINPYYETIGNYNVNGVISFQKKNHRFSIDGGRNYFDGWTDNDPFIEFPKERLADTNRVKTWKPKEQYFGGLRYQVAFKNKSNLSAFGKFFDELIVNRGTPSAPYYENAFDDYYHTQRMDFGVMSNNHLKNGKLNVLLAYNNYVRKKNTYYKDLTTLQETLSVTDGAQDTSRFDQFTTRITYNSGFPKISTLNYQVGVDVNYSNGYGDRIENGQQSIGDYAGFISAEWKLKKAFVLKPGIRYGYNSQYDSPVVPSLNMLYRIKKITFRASAARGFRAPDLKELYLDFVDINHNIQGNPALLAENSWNYTLFVNWMKAVKNKTALKIEYGAFYNDISNLITLGALPDNSFTYINIGTYSTVGQKLAFIVKSSKLNVNINAAYIGRFNADSNIGDAPRYSFSPELGANISYSFLKDRLKTNLFYKFNGELQSYYINQNEEIETTTQSSYSILDASVSAYFFSDKQFMVTLGAKNILNVKRINITGNGQGIHSGSSSINAGRGTSMFLSLRYTFHSKQKIK